MYMQTRRHSRIKEDDDNVIQLIVSKYVPYWPLFILALFIAAGIAYIYLRYCTPLYEATATLIIKDERKGNEESKLVESLDQISAKKIVENEIEIIQSRKVMENVVKMAGLYAPVYEKGDVHDILAYTRFPLSIMASFPDSLTGSDKIYIKYDERSKQVILNNVYKYPIDSLVRTQYGLLKFVPNNNFGPGTVSKTNIFY